MNRTIAVTVLLSASASIFAQACGEHRGESIDEETELVQRPFSNATVCRVVEPLGLCVLEADHENITHDALIFLNADPLDRITLSNTLVDVNQGSSAAHFDGCSFVPGMNQINDRYDRVLELLDPTNLRSERAQRLFGEILHRAQDVYSHSNWVELRQVVTGLPELLDSGFGPWTAFSGRYQPIGSPAVLIVQGQPPRRLTPALNPVTLPWPQRVLVRFQETGQYGLASGAAGDPNRCPTTVPASHAEFNKDHTGRTGFTEAKALAIRQTRHEWCRLVSLVRGVHGARGDSALYDDWVGDVQSAACGDAADLFVVDDSAPPSSHPLQPSESRTYQLKLRNAGTGPAYGTTWEAMFSGAIAAVGSATVATPSGTTACRREGLTVNCRIADTVRPCGSQACPEAATVELEILAAETPGSISMAIEASCHNPDPDTANNRATIMFQVGSPGTISGTIAFCFGPWPFGARPLDNFAVAWRDNGDGAFSSDTDTSIGGVVDAQGAFTTESLEPGLYWLATCTVSSCGEGTDHNGITYVPLTLTRGQSITGFQAGFCAG